IPRMQRDTIVAGCKLVSEAGARRRRVGGSMTGILTMAIMAATMSATPCEGLKAISISNMSITKAEFVPEGVYTPPPPPRGSPPPADAAPRGGRGGAPAQPIVAPAHCKVVAVLKPSSDSVINMEMWLPPADKWNGKFEAVGNGGWAGSIQGLSSTGG